MNWLDLLLGWMWLDRENMVKNVDHTEKVLLPLLIVVIVGCVIALAIYSWR